MTVLILGLALFLGSHSISIFADPWRNSVATRLGAQAWQGIYSVVAAAGLGLIIWGYGLARQEPTVIYMGPLWLRHAALLLMVPVFPLMFAAYLPGRIRERLGHPMLLGTLLWALTHLLVNGNLADLLLFGGFLVWACMDLVSMKWRTSRAIQTLPKRRFNDLIAVVAGLALYGVFLLWGHAWLTGIAVW